MKKIFLLSICFLALALNQIQAQNGKSMWTKVLDSQVPLRPLNERKIIPAKYDVWKLDFQALKNVLNQAPMEMTETANPVFVTLPMPDGKEVTLEVQESPVAHPDLMAKYPSFKTFSGVGGRNKEYSGRFDYTLDGFHASLNTPEGEVYIDPYATEILNHYIVYYTAGYQRVGMTEPFRCGVVDANGGAHNISNKINANEQRSQASQVKVRKYRLAMGATGEFTTNAGGTKEKALSVMVALINRTNKVSMKEVAVRFELLANTDTLIWLNPKTDPFLYGNVGSQEVDPNTGAVLKVGILATAHQEIRKLVGINSFDIGHILTGNCTDVGGVAGGRACDTNGKGSGVTCHNASVDQTAISIIAHEMAGHQFSASHTMSSCSALRDDIEAAQVGSSSKIEPGSGSTIMSYDGSCGPDNITGQYYKQEGYYSVGSIGQITSHIKANPTCGSTVEIANHVPESKIIHKTKGLYIPRFTAFELTTSATDEDNDNLRYSWEQSDYGSFYPLGRQNLESNSFRVFEPVASPTRTFPKLDNIVKGKATKDELYPDTSRLYTFVCFVRDNNILGGGTDLDTITFRSTHTAGPFYVMYPNVLSDTVNSGDYMIVKWNVANTNGSLVNCQHVNILLSTDGGYTYPITLLKNTANDGEEGVILPQGLVSSSARIRINAVDNIFFDISNKDFTIRSQNKDAYTVAFNSERQKYCLPDTAILNIQSAALGNYDKTIKLSVTGLPQGAIAKFDSDTLTPNQNTRLVIDLAKVTQQGDITINLIAIAGTDTIYRSTKIRTVSADFSALAFTTPSVGATAVSPLPSFKWAASPNAELYDFQLATNPSFAAGTVIGSFNNLTANELNSPVSLEENKLYFWRIRAKNNCTVGEWITPAPFHTLVQACNEYKNTKVNNIPASQAITIDSQIDVAESGIISDINVTGIKGTHANFGHLELRLISPSGKVSFLSDKKCAFQGGNALNMRYDDESTLVNKCDKLLSSGTYYRPETPLSVFDGENTKGLWTCQIKDVAAGDGGSITEWSVRFCSSTSVSAPSLIKNDTLKVRPNNGRFISDSLLLATDDKATPQQLTYTLVTLPKSGKLERWAGGALEVGTTFSQAEINQRNLIRYVHGNNAAKNDFFLFVLTDGEGGFAGTLRYNILIDSKAPLSNVQDPTLAQAVKVYPNPTQNILNVSIYQNTTQLTKLQLFNVSGQQVTEKYLHEGEDSTQIDTSILPEGLYLLKISNSTGFATKRVVVQR